MHQGLTSLGKAGAKHRWIGVQTRPEAEFEMVTARPARLATLLVVALGFASLIAEGPSAISGPASAAVTFAIGAAPVSHSELTKMMPGGPIHGLLAQAGDLTPPPSPEAIVTMPPPAPLAEAAPPPLPGYPNSLVRPARHKSE